MTTQTLPLQLVKTTAFMFRAVNGQQHIMDTTTVNTTTQNPNTITSTVFASCTCPTGLDS